MYVNVRPMQTSAFLNKRNDSEVVGESVCKLKFWRFEGCRI